MTVPAESNKVIYAGDGSTTAFPFTFTLPSDSTGTDVLGYVVDNLGNVTLLASNYTVDVTNKKFNYPTVGGVSPLPVGDNALPSGWELVIIRIETIEQILSLISQGIFDAASIMLAFDKIVMILQQLQEQLDRCVKVALNTPNTVEGPVIPATQAMLPLYKGTYAQIKSQAAAAPTQQAWGWASDLNAGSGQLAFYTANASIGDSGWILMPTSFIGV